MSRYDNDSLKAILKEWEDIFLLFDKLSSRDLFSRVAVVVDLMKRIQSVFTAKSNNPALIIILMKKITHGSFPILLKLASESKKDGMSFKERCLKERCYLASSTIELLQARR